VIHRYEDLWREQWRQLDSINRKCEAGLPLNYNRQFGHFATAFLEAETLLDLSARTGLSGAISNLKSRALPPLVQIDEVQRVIEQCGRRPQMVKELVASGDATTLNTVTWLWKKGYLETRRVNDA